MEMNINEVCKESGLVDDLFLQKYQPKYWEDFNNSPIIEMLNTIMGIDKINVLFIGDIGCGKTTYLNAIINEYYKNIPKEQLIYNILHINSLKEQGINFCRNDVKTFCQTYSNIPNRKKIVVLDDIDLINEQSQQVFRNFIDKYSSNVHFIATCSNSQKVIETLQSRFLIIKLTQLETSELEFLMNKIIRCENLDITEEAKHFILTISNGSAKILINFLEKIKLLDMPINHEIAINICSNISILIFEAYTNYVLLGNITEAIKLMYEISDQGYSVMDILDNYFIFVKITKMLNEMQKYDIIPIICKYISIFHNIHEDEIELSLFTNNLHAILHKEE